MNKKNRLHKAVLLSTLAFTQCIGTVSLVQNSIIQTYAEEKNKDVTSQQFLDYIKDLKQKYPNFKFEEHNVVYNSLQEAQQAELQQKQQLEQSIKQYEDTKKQSKDEYDAKVNKYNQDVAAYNQAKQEWDAKKAELESKKTEEGQLTETLAQNLIFKDEPNAEVSVSGNFQGYWKRSDNRYGNDYGNVDYKPERGDTLEQSWTGGYATWKASNDNFLGLPVVLSQGDSITATYTNLQNSSYAGKKISKIEYTISSNQTQPHSVFVLKNPALGLWTYNTKEGNNTVQTNLTMKFYDEEGNLIEFDENHPALVNIGSLNSGTTASGYRYVEKVYNQNFRFVPINGSLIKESVNHEIYAVDEDTDNPTNYKGWDSTKWDRIGNPNMWFGSGTGVVTSGNTISLSTESNASGQWLIVNGAVTTKDVLPPLLATYPDALEPHHDPDYQGNNGTRNTIYYSRVLIRQLTTEWVDKDGKELKAPITDTDIKPAGTISHYVFDHDDTDNEGNVRHVYKQLETRWEDRNGKTLKEPVKDSSIQDKGTIDDYAFVETKVEGDITTHIFRQFSTKWVDENNKDIKPEFVGDKTKDKDDFSDYAFVNTETVDGNLIHHYRQYTTEWVTEDNTPLKDKFTGKEVKDSGTVPNYKFLETKTDEKGNVKHIFTQFTTSWIDENKKELSESTKSDEFKEEKQFEGYKLIGNNEEGRNKTYVYHKLTTEWIEDETNTQLKKQDGTHDHGDIDSYIYVRTETKENGDLVHVFKKVEQKTEQKTETTQKKTDNIPTGVGNNSLINLFMVLVSSIGLFMTNVFKRREV
jgi:surface repeat SSSPR-51 protein